MVSVLVDNVPHFHPVISVVVVWYFVQASLRDVIRQAEGAVGQGGSRKPQQLWQWISTYCCILGQNCSWLKKQIRFHEFMRLLLIKIIAINRIKVKALMISYIWLRSDHRFRKGRKVLGKPCSPDENMSEKPENIRFLHEWCVIILVTLHTRVMYPFLDSSSSRARMLIWSVYRIWGNRSYKGNNQLKCNACAC